MGVPVRQARWPAAARCPLASQAMVELTLPHPSPPSLPPPSTHPTNNNRTCGPTPGPRCATTRRQTAWSWSRGRVPAPAPPAGARCLPDAGLLRRRPLPMRLSSALPAVACCAVPPNPILPGLLTHPACACSACLPRTRSEGEAGADDRSLNQMVDDSADAVVVRWAGAGCAGGQDAQSSGMGGGWGGLAATEARRALPLLLD